jgi:calcineurin-like phosphoesterase family protein
MNVWFTADTHFGHKNVIGYCKRPYENVEEMNEDMIRMWNETVAPEDYIYHIGDFAFMNKAKLKEIVPRLNGRIVLIKGNHDRNRKREYFLECGMHEVFEIGHGETVPYWGEDEEILFHMCHYPMRHVMGDYDQRDYLVPHAPRQEDLHAPLVHGHVHQQWKLRPNMVNVGCDVWDLRPVSLEELLIRVRFVGNWPDGNSHEDVV